MVSTAIILGSSRYDGNTRHVVSMVEDDLNAKIYLLKDFAISPYDYQHQNANDDFFDLIRELLQYDHWLFATPLYWYSMSAAMKIFIDRFSDLISIEKDLGRQLRGKTVSVLCTGEDLLPPDCFEQTFKLTFDYLGMDHKGLLYTSYRSGQSYTKADFSDAIETFIAKIQA